MKTTLSTPYAAAAEEAEPDPPYQSVNPFDGKVVKTFETFTARQLEEIRTNCAATLPSR